MRIYVHPLGDTSLIIEFQAKTQDEANTHVHTAYSLLRNDPLFSTFELVPAYTTIAIHYSLDLRSPVSYVELESQIRQCLLKRQSTIQQSRSHYHIPVCYEEPFARDLNTVARTNRLSMEEVVSIHSSAQYIVSFLGFSPGFPFLRGLPQKIWTPRKETPLIQVEGGSVGIANNQTGIYPTNSPGGWQIIGRTPVVLFSAESSPPSLLTPGDTVTFYPISKDDFSNWMVNR